MIRKTPPNQSDEDQLGDWITWGLVIFLALLAVAVLINVLCQVIYAIANMVLLISKKKIFFFLLQGKLVCKIQWSVIIFAMTERLIILLINYVVLVFFNSVANSGL
jgi:hypothetical protein